ncbi:MAG: hypothetical protein ACOY7U_06250 [Acidobacteriota bacterium]
MTAKLEHAWEIELPGTSAQELLAGLAARDRVFGQNVTLEPEDDPKNTVEAWLGSSDALDGKVYRLAVYADLEGPEEYLEAARDALMDLVDEQVAEAQKDAAGAKVLDRKPSSEVSFELISEEEETPQLILPEWLAPEEADLPWGFRPVTKDGKPWPDPEVLKAHERVVLVPFKGEYILYSLPPLEG